MAYTTIDDPSAYFKVSLHTGNNTNDHAITFSDTDTTMQPALVWIKSRDNTEEHMFTDSVRPINNYLASNNSDAEDVDSDNMQSLDSNGFTMGVRGSHNANTIKYVAWCWKAGTTSGINATGADVTPQAYSFDQTAGFSIIDYHPTADTANQEVPHGLAAVPHLIIAKTTNSAQDWAIYHHKNTAAPETDYLELNNNQATTDSDAWWSDTAPTSVLFTVGTASETGGGNENIAYCWTGKQGFSKFGSYTGNGNADGPFVYTGFRPAFILIKNTGAAEDWWIMDNKREGFNSSVSNRGNFGLQSNSTSSENTNQQADILSNGFKLTATSAEVNSSGATYIYAAFAEAPFVNSNGVPCNAR